MRVMGLSGSGGVDLNAPILVACGYYLKPETIMPRGVYARPTPEQQFWRRVVKGESPDDCWGWVGAVDPFGYSRFPVERVSTPAHRFSYELHHGPIPDGQVVRHKCHNPPCSNPLHLVAGTQAENISDSVSDGRHCHGESHGCAKLTVDQVLEIRACHAGGESYPSLAGRFGVSTYTIGEICRRETWSHV